MKIWKFLNQSKYKVDDSNPIITHTSIKGGKWNIPPSDLPELYKAINEYCIINGNHLPLTERIRDIHPLIFDIDLKYNESLSNHAYTNETIEKLNHLLWNLIIEHFDVDLSNNELWVLEKSIPYPSTSKSYKMKDGIHYIFPKIIVEKASYKLFVKEIQKYSKEIEEIFKDTCSIMPSNSVETLVDGCFTGWMPYGCSKEGEDYYKLNKVYKLVGDKYQLIDDEEFNLFYTDNLKIMNAMSMLREDLEVNTLPEESIKPLKTVSSNDSMSMEVSDNQDYGEYYVDNNMIVNKYQIVEEHEIELIKGLIGCLSEERAEIYDKWLAVGMCLHNINSDKSKGLLHSWHEFSLKYENYKQGNSKRNCEAKWKSFDNGYLGPKLGKGSLLNWAKEDNPEEFDRVKRNNIATIIEKTAEEGHEADYLIAKAIRKFYDGEYVCVDINDDWHYFKDNARWETTLKGNRLRNQIHNDIYNVYVEYETDYKEKLTNDENKISNYKFEDAAKAAVELKLKDQDDIDELVKQAGTDNISKVTKLLKKDLKDKNPLKVKHKNVQMIKKKLLKDSFVSTLINSLKHEFYEKDVMERFDSNLDLLGFENGVYDLKENVFREGRPEDYITMSTKLTMPVDRKDLPMKLDDLVKVVSQSDIIYGKDKVPFERANKDLLLFMKQLFPSGNVRNYIYRWLSKCLSGENRDEGFYIWTGTGGNGKSKLVELMSMTIGDYFSNLSVALLTQKRKASGAASPELEKTKGKRLVVMQEPDVNETINVGEMKELTGNDKIEARALFKEPIEFTPQYKMLMMCNDLPEVPSNDDGTWRRIEGVPFDSKFVENKDEVNPEQNIYLRDKKLKGKFPFWTLPLMIKLLQEWREYDKHGIIIPEEVKNKTKSFRNDNDVVGMWIDQCCETADNVKVSDTEQYAPTEFDVLYLELSEWTEVKEYKKPSRPKVMEAFNKWQAKSQFGLSLGKKKSDKCVNGTEQEPLYNLIVS